MIGTVGTRLKTRVLEAARENGEAMWRQTTLSVAGDKRAEVTSVVQRYFEANRRFGITEWAEPGRVIAVSTRGNLWTGGEAIEVRVSEGVDSSTTQVQVLSVLSAMYDWGKNRRNVRRIAELSVECGDRLRNNDDEPQVRNWRTLRISIPRTRLGLHFRIIMPQYAGSEGHFLPVNL